LGGRVSYYRDRYGLEADIVLHLEDGRYALIECKLGSRDIDEGASHLLEIKRLIRQKNGRLIFQNSSQRAKTLRLTALLFAVNRNTL